MSQDNEEDWEIRPMTSSEYYLSREDEILADAQKCIEKIEKNSNKSRLISTKECKQIIQNLQNMTREEEELERMFKLGSIMKKSKTKFI
jgi:hypothetical protein